MNAVENINCLEIPECTLFNSYTFSNYITLVDKKGVPVVFDFNGESCFFTFKKCHLSLNLDNHKNDFKFFEKLYIAGLLKSDYQWKNLLMIKCIKQKHIKKNIILHIIYKKRKQFVLVHSVFFCVK